MSESFAQGLVRRTYHRSPPAQQVKVVLVSCRSRWIRGVAGCLWNSWSCCVARDLVHDWHCCVEGSLVLKASLQKVKAAGRPSIGRDWHGLTMDPCAASRGRQPASWKFSCALQWLQLRRLEVRPGPSLEYAQCARPYATMSPTGRISAQSTQHQSTTEDCIRQLI